MAVHENKTCLASKDDSQTDTSTGQVKVLGVAAAPAVVGASIKSPPMTLIILAYVRKGESMLLPSITHCSHNTSIQTET